MMELINELIKKKLTYYTIFHFLENHSCTNVPSHIFMMDKIINFLTLNNENFMYHMTLFV